MTKVKKLTGRQQKFVQALLADPKMIAKDAAVKAGYSPKNAAQSGNQLLGYPMVQAAIEEAKERRAKRNKVDADAVLTYLEEVKAMDITEILNDDMTMKPMSTWPKIWRECVSGVDLKTGKLRWPDKLKNLELIGKHVGVRAFAELVEIKDTSGIADRLTRARERNKKAG